MIVFENIKGGKSSFTIHIGENLRKVQFQSSTLIKALKMCIVKELLGYFFLNLDKQRIHGRLF